MHLRHASTNNFGGRNVPLERVQTRAHTTTPKTIPAGTTLDDGAPEEEDVINRSHVVFLKGVANTLNRGWKALLNVVMTLCMQQVQLRTSVTSVTLLV